MRVGRTLKLVYSSLVRSVDARMQPLELTAMQWEPLLLLARGRADTVAALARECDMDPGAMTRMLDRLEQKHLLARSRSEADRRVVHLALTDKGREAAAARAARTEQERLTAETDRIGRLKDDVEARAAALVGRSAQVEAQQATLAVLRAKLDRRHGRQGRDRVLRRLLGDDGFSLGRQRLPILRQIERNPDGGSGHQDGKARGNQSA